MQTTNISTNSTHIYISISLSITTGFSIVLCSIFAMSLIFNILSITTILKAKAYTTINLLILNLSFADLTYSLGIPFYIIELHNKSMPFGWFGCRMFIFTEFCGITVGLFTITALSVERFFEVADKKKRLNNFSNKFKVFIIIVYIVFLWLFAIGFTMPLVMSVDSKSESLMINCNSNWPEETIKYYFLAKFFLIFFIPYLILIISSAKLLIFLNQWKKRLNETLIFNAKKNDSIKLKRMKQNKLLKIEFRSIKGYDLVVSNEALSNADDSSYRLNRLTSKQSEIEFGRKNSIINGIFLNSIRKKAIRLVLSIVFIFLIQWSPLWVFQFFNLFSSIRTENVHFINIFVSTLSYSNTIVNPLLYMLLTYNFRKYFKNNCFTSSSLKRSKTNTDSSQCCRTCTSSLKWQIQSKPKNF